MQAVFGFDSVGADVLHRCGSDQARNQRQVLKSTPALVDGPLHEFVPVFSCGGLNYHISIAFFDDAPPGPRHSGHRAFEVAGEQHVGSTAQEQCVGTKSLGVVEVLHHVHFGLKVVKSLGRDVKAKGVIGLQRSIVLDPHDLGSSSGVGSKAAFEHVHGALKVRLLEYVGKAHLALAQ